MRKARVAHRGLEREVPVVLGPVTGHQRFHERRGIRRKYTLYGVRDGPSDERRDEAQSKYLADDGDL